MMIKHYLKTNIYGTCLLYTSVSIDMLGDLDSVVDLVVNDPVQAGAMAVSYTHLDVYTRQG